MLRVLLCALLLWPALALARGESWRDHPEWETQFSGRGVSGSIVVYDERAQAWHVFDRARAQARYSPASTFKLFNARVALEAGAVADEHEVMRWDGVKRTFDDWNRDHTLASGMKFSVVWYYQAIARRIGAARMQAWLDRVGYGNRDIGGGIDRFWLDGALRISQVEQVAFLRRLASGTLPFRPGVQEAVRRIAIVEAAPGWILYAKTGWALVGAEQADFGWYVGWLERDGRRWLFALTIDMPRAREDAPKRIAIARSVLARIGALPGDPPATRPAAPRGSR
ncbi:MAG TPA: class D beta-lactamase [Dokdonella sp.]